MRNKELIKQQKIIRTILDKKYFHVCTILENEEMKWRIYYKNLPNKVYYSPKNEPLLTSEKNSIQDIFKLKRKFEEEKSKEASKYVFEIMPFSSWLGRKLTQLFNIFINFFLVIWLTMYGMYISAGMILKSSIASFAFAIAMIAVSIASIVFTMRLSKKCKKIVIKFEEKFIQNKIRNMGLYFVNKIKI